jgi:hypothetical protein
VGRAVRDETGRIFYVLPKQDGSGHYGALTRTGSLEDEQRTAAAAAFTQTTHQEQPESAYESALHDATGRRRGSWRGTLMIALLLVIIMLLALLSGRIWFDRRTTRMKPLTDPEPPARGPTAPSPTPLGVD